MVAVTGELPPAGWYHDGYGLRWWDGTAWGPYAPQPMYVVAPARTDPRLWATLVHLGFFVGGFVGPLVVRLTEERKDSFVRHHSTEALNGNLTLLAAYVGLYVGGLILTAFTHQVWLIIVSLGLVAIVFLTMLVQMILGAVKASRGEWFRYPVNVRFVRGAVPPPPKHQP